MIACVCGRQRGRREDKPCRTKCMRINTFLVLAYRFVLSCTCYATCLCFLRVVDEVFSKVKYHIHCKTGCPHGVPLSRASGSPLSHTKSGQDLRDGEKKEHAEGERQSCHQHDGHTTRLCTTLLCSSYRLVCCPLFLD